MEPITIPDAELRLMEWIWNQPGLRAVDLCRLAKETYGWSRQHHLYPSVPSDRQGGCSNGPSRAMAAAAGQPGGGSAAARRTR